MGEGVPHDADAAYECFTEARNNGHTYAEFFAERMERGEQELQRKRVALGHKPDDHEPTQEYSMQMY